MLLMSSLGTKKKGNWNSDEENSSRQWEIILRNNGTIFALGHSQSTGGKNFLVVPCIYDLKTIVFYISSVLFY